MRYDISEIGESIKAVQRRNETSQQAFADRIGFNISTVSKWIRGENMPSLLGLIVICDVYDVRITDLVKPIPTPYKPKRMK